MAWVKGMVRNMGMGEIKVRQFVEFSDNYEKGVEDGEEKKDLFAEVMCDEEENEFNLGSDSYAV